MIGAGPCGLTALKNLLQAGCRNVVCYEESGGIGGNWAFTDDPHRASVHECSHIISSRRMSSFDDFPMPDDYPDFPSHRQMLAYFTDYARAFRLEPHIRLGSRVERCDAWRRWPMDGSRHRERRDEGGTLRQLAGLLRPPPRSVRTRVPGHVRRQDRSLVGLQAPRPVPRPARARGRRGQLRRRHRRRCRPPRLRAPRSACAREPTSFRSSCSASPIDIVYAFWRGKVPRPLLRSALKLWLRLDDRQVGGLRPANPGPRRRCEKHPTLNSGVLEALRHGRLVARRGIERYDGHTVHFTDGTQEEFDAIIMATGFRTSFPFLPEQIAGWDMTRTPPLYLKMMHPTIPSLFFIGLFQPIGCIWRLADYQARIAALQISGRLNRPPDIDARIRHEVAHPHHRVRSLAPARDRGRLSRLPAQTTQRTPARLNLASLACTAAFCRPRSVDQAPPNVRRGAAWGQGRGRSASPRDQGARERVARREHFAGADVRCPARRAGPFVPVGADVTFSSFPRNPLAQ